MSDENGDKSNLAGLTLGSSELSDLAEKTLGPAQKKLNEFGLKAAGEGWKAFKRILGTTTEPFFRMGMGERYYSYGAFFLGMYLWIGMGYVGAQIAPDASIAAILTQYKPFHFLAFIFQHQAFPIVFGFLMALVQAGVGLRNIREAVRFQRQGIIHHSYSRGAPVWRNEGMALVMIEAVLLMFNWPTAILFAVGYGMNWRLKSAQDAAIRERYLDAVDKDIEQKFLKDSALGNCPPEMTFLYHQLDPEIKPEVRENMAAALVGEPVSVVAKPPQRRKSASQPLNAGMPAAATPEITETPTLAVDPESELGKMARQKHAGLSALSPINREEFMKWWNLGLRIRRYVILGFMIAIGLFVCHAASNFIQSHWKQWTAASAAKQQSTQSAAQSSVTAPAQAPQVVQTPVASTPVAPAIQNQQRETPPAMVAPVASAPEIKSVVPPAIATDTAAVETTAPTVAATPASQDQVIAQINGVLANELAKVAAFKTNCDNILANDKLKIDNLRGSLKTTFVSGLTVRQNLVAKVVESEKAALDKVPQQLQAVLDKKSEDPQLFLDKLKAGLPKLEDSRQQVSKALDQFATGIAAATR